MRLKVSLELQRNYKKQREDFFRVIFQEDKTFWNSSIATHAPAGELHRIFLSSSSVFNCIARSAQCTLHIEHSIPCYCYLSNLSVLFLQCNAHKTIKWPRFTGNIRKSSEYAWSALPFDVKLSKFLLRNVQIYVVRSKMFRTFQFAAFRYESKINPKKELQSVGQMSLTFLFGTILKHAMKMNWNHNQSLANESKQCNCADSHLV